MKKILQEKRTLWKKIMSWILVMAILFTSADLSVFTVGAEEPVDFSSEADEDAEESVTAAESAVKEDTAETAQQDLTEIGTEVFSDSADFSDSGEDLTEEIPQGETEELFTDEDIFSDGSVSQNGSEDFSSEEKPQEEQTEKTDFTLKVFEDTNKNGAWDEGENGITGLEAEVSLHGTEDKTAAQSVEPGIYSLNGLNKGIYTIRLLAEPEIISPYNLAESVNLSPDKEKIQFPDVDDTWVLSWTEIDLSQTKELFLGLQRDDLAAIEEEISDVEVMEGKNGEMLFSSGPILQPRLNINLKYFLLEFLGSKVYVYYDDGTPFNGAGNWSYIAIGGEWKDLVYCIEPFVASGGGAFQAGGDLAKVYGAAKAKRMQLYAYYGSAYPWPGKDSDDRAGYYLAAQKMIWEETGAQHVQWSHCLCKPSGCMPGMPLNSVIGVYENNIRNKIANHDKVPSIDVSKKLEHDYTNLDKIYEYTDKNYVLGNGRKNGLEGWEVTSYPPGLRNVKIANNKLQFKMPKDSKYDGKTLNFTLKKKFPNIGYNQYYVSVGSRRQALLAYNAPSELTYNCRINVQASNKVKIQKFDDGKNPVSGMTFKWGWSRDKLIYETEATDISGCTEIQATAGKWIYVQEGRIPEHLVKDPTIKFVQVKKDQINTVTFTNQRKTQYVSLKKVDSETGNPVKGAKFKYWNKEMPNTVYTGITDANGEFSSYAKFPVGSTVVMEEIEPAPGYEVLPNGQRQQKKILSLNESENVFQFRNTPKKIPIRIRKINARTGEAVPGVKFMISSAPDFRPHKVYTTDEKGILETTETFAHGTRVYYQEIECPERYEINSEIRSFVVDASKQNVQEIVVYNHEGPIGFSIKKKGDDGRPLEGVRFRLEQYNGSYWYTLYDNLVTDKEGKLTIPGTYNRDLIAKKWLRLVEESTIPGYELLEDYIYFDNYANSEQKKVVVPVVNKRIPTSVVIIKKDDKDGAEAKYLQGALFAITDSSGRVVETLMTDQKGTAYTSELMADTQYYIEEISPPYGYEKIEGRVPLILDETNSYKYSREFPNKPYYGRIVIHKKDQTGRPLPGIEFTVYKDYLPIAKMVTDKNGEAFLDKLVADGRYRIVETYAPPQYQFPSFDYTVDFLLEEEKKDEDKGGYHVSFDKKKLEITFDISNEELFGSVTIKKVDAQDHTIPVKGAQFNLYDRFTGEQIGETLTTNADGICSFSNLKLVNPTVSLQQGYYYIEEITPGENHILPEETKKYFSLTADNKDITVTFENPPVTGSVEITKVDKDNPEIKLQGAEFAIYTAEDCEKEEFSNPVQIVETNENGIALFKDLRYGDYVIKETKAPPYYRNDPINGGNSAHWNNTLKGYPVKIDKDGQKIAFEVENPKLKLQIQVLKTEKSSGQPVAGVEFELRNKNHQMIEKLVTDGSGKISSKEYYAEELGEGAYLVETKVPYGYELDSTHHLIEYDSNLEASVCVIKKEITNEIEKPDLKIQKVDEDGEGVEAIFEVMVFDEQGVDISEHFASGTRLIKTTQTNPIADFRGFFSALNNVIKNQSIKGSQFTFEIYETGVDKYHIINHGKIATLIYTHDVTAVKTHIRVEEVLADVASFDELTLTLKVVNKKKPVRIIVNKHDNSYYQIPLSGAVFEIIPVDHPELKATVTTNEQGRAEAVFPYFRKYTIQEIKSPPGYFLDSNIITLESEHFTSLETEFTYQTSMSNRRHPQLLIYKKGLPGENIEATFRIRETRFDADIGQETMTTTKDGFAYADLSAFSGMDVAADNSGTLEISEVAVSDPSYAILKEPVKIDWLSERGKFYFFKDNHEWPAGVILEDLKSPGGDVYGLQITVTDEKKNYSYNIKKAGQKGETNASATINAKVGGKNYIKSINNNLQDITNWFSGLTGDGPIHVSITETSCSSGYKPHRNPVTFDYYPNAEDDEKFQNMDEHIQVEKTENGKDVSFTITLINEYADMELVFEKVSELGGSLAGAEFLLTTNRGYTAEYVTKGVENEKEKISFPYAEEITLTETKPPQGHRFGPQRVWKFTSNDFKYVEKLKVYQNEFPYVLKNWWDFSLEMNKTDHNYKPVDATFEIEEKTYLNKKWIVETQDGNAELSSIVKEILTEADKQNRKDSTKLFVTEIAASDGLQTPDGVLAEIIVNVDNLTVDVSPKHRPFFSVNTNSELSSSISYIEDNYKHCYSFAIKNNPIAVKLKLVKKEKDKEDVFLAGAKYRITPNSSSADAKPIEVETKASSEGVEVSLPWAKSYIVEEIKAPEGYILDPTPYTYSIKEFTDETGTGGAIVGKNLSVSHDNVPITGKLQITKVDADTKDSLNGARFKLYKGPLNEGDSYEQVVSPTYPYVGEVTVDETGIGTYENLRYGDYILKEVEAPVDYQLTEELYQVQVRKEKETVHIQVPNHRKEGTLEIIKQDDSSEKSPLANAVFTVHRKKDNVQIGDPLVTGEDGTISVQLPYGDYYFKEVSFPSGYVPAAGKTYDFTLSGIETTAEVIVPNKKASYALRLFKRDGNTGEYLAGAEFGLFNQNEKPETNTPIQTFTTNANGSAVVFLEHPGNYDIYELKPPAGYRKNEQKYSVTVTDDEPTVEIVADNTKQLLNIEIHKTDEIGTTLLPGAVFEIRNAKTGALVATTGVTGENGMVSVEVPAGDFEYTVTEIQAPEGYVLDSTPVPVEIIKKEENGQVTYEAKPITRINKKAKGNIKLVKTDETGQKPLEGAVFGVYKEENSEPIETLTTNSKGEAMSGNLDHGKYYLQEITPPEGYEKSEERYPVELTETTLIQIVKATNTAKKGGFKVLKVEKTENGNQPIKGKTAEFKVFASYEDAQNLKNEKQVASTDVDTGIAAFTDLPYGIYYARETKAPEGYKLSDRIYTVTVDENSAETVILEVENYKEPEDGIFRVRKKDADTGAALAGAVFTVEGPIGENSKTYTYTTAKDGSFTTDPLEPGTYTVTETKAPEGYRISDPASQDVEVKAGDGILSEAVEYEFLNEKIQFPIHIVKTDDSQSPKRLPGAEFKLYQLNDQGERIEPALETLITNVNGEAVSRMLSPGTYEIEEVTPPAGYKLANPSSQKVTITENAESTIEFSYTFKNSPETGVLQIKKVGLAEGETPENNKGTPLSGAVFEAVNTETGMTYTAKSNQEGLAEFTELPFGIYHVKETTVPEGYEDGSPYEETVVISRETTEEGPVVLTRTAYNYKIYGAVMLTKKDSETGVLVGGATYGIYTKLLTNNDVDPLSHLKGYDLVTSGTDAYVASKPLELGTYYMKEISPPAGYKKNPQIYPVEITKESPIVSIEAEDEAYKGSVSIHKVVEGTDEPLEGVVFALYTKENYDKLLGSTEEHQIDVPADYLTTDSNGNAKKEGLTLGQEYVLVEFTAPPGYEMDKDPRRFTPAPDGQRDFSFNFKNKKKTMLTIHKQNEGGGAISDVSFTIFGYGLDGVAETDDDERKAQFSPEITGTGIARYDISDFANGWYYVKETQGSDQGFEVSQNIIPFEITDEKRDYEFFFVNYRPKGEISIQKQDEIGNPLPGAEFALYIPKTGWFTGEDKKDIEFFKAFVMDEKGYGILKDIPAGVYLLRETKAPEGYKPIEDILISLYRDGQKGEKDGRVYYSYHYDAVNRPITGWISIQKKAVLDGLPIEDMDLSNAEFTITNEKGEVVDTLVTGYDGIAVSKELPQGTYTIQETKAPEGTVLNGETKTITIDGKDEDDIYTYTHENPVAKGKIQIKKVDGDDPNATLKGAEFDILKEGSTEIADHLVIGDNGIGISKELPYGRYIIRETKSPDGYGLQIRDIRCMIQKDQETVELKVENFKTPEDAQVLVVKYDKDNPSRYLGGAEFELYKDEALTEKVEGKFVTDEKGKIALKKELGLIKGKTYYLKEIKAPDGYVLDETVHSFTLDPVTEQTIALYIPNEKEKGYIQFKKTGEMLIKLENSSAEYPDLKKPVWEQKTLEDAEIGIYAVEPVELDGKTYDKGELIQRLRSGKTSRPLPLGRYQYKELSAPKGYILDDKFHDVDVTKENIEEANPAMASMENTHTSVSLELHKKFKDGNGKFSDVWFGVFAASTFTSNQVEILKDTLLGIIKLDDNGKSIEKNLKLPEGAYYVMEIATSDGYVLDGHKYLFKTEYKNKDQKIVISTAENPIVNEPVYGTIRLEKTGDMFTGVQRLVNQEGKYQVNKPVYSKGELKGAEVQIKATETITIGDKIYRKGEVVDTLISGEKDESIKLPLGTYTLVETKAPEGYVLDTKKYPVTIEANTTANQPSVAIHKLENKKAIPKIQLYKNFFGQTDADAKGLYEKVLFGVYAQEDIRGASSDAVLRKDELVGLIRMKEDGTGTFADDTCLPFGSYYVKELETAEDYQVSDKEYPFTVNAETMGSSAEPEGTPETGEESVYRGIPIEGISKDNPVLNSPEGAKVPFAFLKTGEDGIPLSGAVFRLYTCANKEEGHQHSADVANADKDCWTEVKGVSPKTSGADGIVDFGILPDGDYQLKETEAPDGYVLPAGQWRFTVDSTAAEGKHIEFKFTGGAKPPAFQKAEDGAVYQYQVSNRKAMPMPFTGGAGLPAYLGGGGALVALSELMRRRRRKKQRSNSM